MLESQCACQLVIVTLLGRTEFLFHSPFSVHTDLRKGRVDSCYGFVYMWQPLIISSPCAIKIHHKFKNSIILGVKLCEKFLPYTTQKNSIGRLVLSPSMRKQPSIRSRRIAVGYK